MKENDTIAAISTPLGEGGIGIVRMSGPDSFAIVRKVFEKSSRQESNYPAARRLYHGFIIDQDGLEVDEVLVAFMPAPYTYTREDVVEINCHSGIISLRRILEIIINAGCRLAEPGEFTKRAFINGRIDLSQAEAVMNIIKARSEEALHFAVKGLRGELSTKIKIIRDKINTLRAPMEASFDYPEEFEGHLLDNQNAERQINSIIEKIEDLLKSVERSKAYTEGVSVAIIGRPNVGKSSLLNALLKQQKAIVHELPGTTRDMLEGFINLGGYPINLIDTAGIQGTDNPVEKEGIIRSKEAASQAKLLIMVFDGSRSWSNMDEEILKLKNKQQGMVAVVNKSDLDRILTVEKMKEKIEYGEVVETSVLTGKGLDMLEKAVTSQLDRMLGHKEEANVMITFRHKKILEEARISVNDSKEALNKQPPEIVSLNLQQAWQKLGEVTGETMNEALLDHIFNEFCLGK